MKTILFASALALGMSGGALAQTPPGDGITQLGNNPEGQPCTPQGFNQGVSAYPPCPAMEPRPRNIEDYPRCGDANTDRCYQWYAEGRRR